MRTRNATEDPPNDVLLTSRLRAVLELIGNGHPNKEISRILNVSERTVRSLLLRIRTKLDTSEP